MITTSKPAVVAMACALMMQTTNTGPILLPDSQEVAHNCRKIAHDAQERGESERIRVVPLIILYHDDDNREEIGRTAIEKIQTYADHHVQPVPAVAAITSDDSTLQVTAATTSFDTNILRLVDASKEYSAEDIEQGERLHELIDRKFLQILTVAEKQELEELLAWRDEQNNAFYRQVALAQE